MVNKDIMVVQWREKDQQERADGKTNIVIGAFTTAYARIRLYRFLEIVQKRCLYMDTDSVSMKLYLMYTNINTV